MVADLNSQIDDVAIDFHRAYKNNEVFRLSDALNAARIKIKSKARDKRSDVNKFRRDIKQGVQ